MITALIIASILQWLLILVLAAGLVALLRQVGMLHERLGPVGALTLPGGPRAGEPAPRFDLVALDGRAVSIAAPGQPRATLLFFLSPTCPVCKTLTPVVQRLAYDERDRLSVVLASDGDEAAQRRMVEARGLHALPLVLSTDLGLRYGVSKLPHAVLIDREGRLVASGLVNNREHLESLLMAEEQGVASIQDFLARRQADRAAG